MPIFEQYFAQRPAEVTRIPHADVRGITDVGAGLEARAKAELGEAITDAAVIVAKWYEREGNTQFDTQRRLARERINEFELMIFDDTAGHDAEYKKMRTDVSKLAPKNNIGASKFKDWFDLQSPNWDNMSAEKKIRMVARNNQTEYFKNIANIALEKDFARARAEAMLLTQGAVDDRTRTPAQAASDFDRIMDEWTSADVWRRATAAVRPDGEVDWEAAAKWFDVKENIEGLPESIVKGFANTARSQASAQKRRDTEKLKQVQEVQRDEIYTMVENNAEDTLETINKSLLPAKEKAALRKLARNPDVALNYPEYDKVVDVIDGVAKDTHTVEQADEAIKAGVGKYFDATIARSLRTKLSQNSKADSPTRRLSLTRAHAVLGRLRSLQVGVITRKDPVTPQFLESQRGIIVEGRTIDELVIDIENSFIRIAAELDEYADTVAGDKDFDDKINKKLQELTRPVREAVTLNWFERMFSPKEEGFFTAVGFNTEAMELVQEKIDVLKDENVWETLNDEEKESARKRFEQGQTVEEIMRLLE